MMRCAVGGRLEPSEPLLDVGRLEEIQDFPCEVALWRHANSTLACQQCQLSDPTIGLIFARCAAIGSLHTLYWGSHAVMVPESHLGCPRRELLQTVRVERLRTEHQWSGFSEMLAV